MKGLEYGRYVFEMYYTYLYVYVLYGGGAEGSEWSFVFEEKDIIH